MGVVVVTEVINDMDIPDVDFSKLAGPSAMQRGGIILETTGRRIELVIVRNAHPMPRNHYRMPNASIDDVLTTPVKRIVGFVHTHLEGQPHTPTKQDLASIPPGKLGVVYHPTRGTAVWYTDRGILRNGYRKIKVRTT